MPIDTTDAIPSSTRITDATAERLDGMHPEICEIASFCGKQAIALVGEDTELLSSAHVAAIKGEFAHVTLDPQQRTELYRFFSNRITELMQQNMPFEHPSIRRLRQIRDTMFEVIEDVR